MGKIRIEAEDRGSAARIARSARSIDRHTRDAMESLASFAQDLFREASPSAPGRPLWEGIEVKEEGTQIFVKVHAYSEEGYDYAPVTRFGHRVDRIYPVKAKALWTPWGPRAWVRGYKPAKDWAEDPIPEIRVLAQPLLSEIGRKWAIEVRI